jgi:hypothetical protein
MAGLLRRVGSLVGNRLMAQVSRPILSALDQLERETDLAPF